MKSFLKQIIAAFILTSFLSIVFFSFNIMMREPDGRMVGGCPFSAMGASLCPQDTVALAVHHISAYYAFLNVPVSSSILLLIIALFIVANATVAIFTYGPLLELPPYFSVTYNSLPKDSNKRKITHWLYLFENSPSLV